MTYSNTAITPLDTLFQFSGHQIQTATDENGTLWACAKDVFEALGVVWNGSQSLRNLPEKWKGVIKLMTPSGSQDTIFIAEPNIYRVIFRSNKPEAERFIEWLTEEVLPAIRKHGVYGRLDIGHQITLRKIWLQIAEKLDRCKNPFIAKALLTEFQSLSREIGAKIDDPNKFRLTSEVQGELEGM